MRLTAIGKTTPTPPPISIIPNKNVTKFGNLATIRIPEKIINETATSTRFAPNFKYRCAVASEKILVIPKVLNRKPMCRADSDRVRIAWIDRAD
jgi:putative transposon-encoded protein